MYITSTSLLDKSMNAYDALPEKIKKKSGRPKGSVDFNKMTMSKLANHPIVSLPKTEIQRVRELKDLLLNSAGSGVVQKAVDIALNDEHPSQMAAIKLCMDRMLPVSLFEKEGKQRNAVTINITGIGGSPIEPVIVDEVEDVEDKNV